MQPDDASDVMQSVFVSVTKNLAQYRVRSDRDSFRGWLYAITRNKITTTFEYTIGKRRLAAARQHFKSSNT